MGECRYEMWAGRGNPEHLEWLLNDEADDVWPSAVWPIVDKQECGTINREPTPEQWFALAFDPITQRTIYDALNHQETLRADLARVTEERDEAIAGCTSVITRLALAAETKRAETALAQVARIEEEAALRKELAGDDYRKIARLREVVGMVEWVLETTGLLVCPWCAREKPLSFIDKIQEGHAPDCPRQSVIEEEGK